MGLCNPLRGRNEGNAMSKLYRVTEGQNLGFIWVRESGIVKGASSSLFPPDLINKTETEALQAIRDKYPTAQIDEVDSMDPDTPSMIRSDR